jgi:hypothetical protein
VIQEKKERVKQEFVAGIGKTAKPLKRSEQLLFKRFEEDYDECASYIEGDNLTEEDVTKILKNSGFIMQVKKHQPMQRDIALSEKMFSILKNEQDEVSKKNLKAFLFIVLCKEPVFNERVSQGPYGGFDSQGNFKLSNPDQMRRIQKDFKPLN